MINGSVVGVVIDNKDPDKMHRVKVRFPVDGEQEVQSSWIRMMSPMAGKQRGLVMLPDIGTEVVLAYAYRSMSPYVIAAVYNGKDDKPETYHNDEKNNDKRIFWSRNDHMVIFDDTSGAEKVELGCKSGSRMDIKGGPIYHSFNSAEKTIELYSGKHIIIEAKETISMKCKDFKLECSSSFASEAGQTAAFASATSTNVTASASIKLIGAAVEINTAAPNPTSSPLDTPAHKHPPTK